MFRPLCRVVVLAILSASFAASAEEARIGLANPFSGPNAPSGERNRTAVQLAIQALNQAGGVLGHEVKLIAVDDGCGIERAADAALELIKAGVVAVIGHSCSHSSLVAAPVYEAVGIPMLTPDSTHPLLTEEGRPNVFRLIGRDDEQGRMAADRLAALRPVRPIAIVHDGSTYGSGLATQARLQLRRNGAQEALYASYPPGAEDYATLIGQLREARIGVLYVAGYGADAARILLAAREQGSKLQMVGGDGLGLEEFWDVAGAAGEGTIFTTPRIPTDSPAAQQVLAAFRALGLGSLPTGLGAYAAVQSWAEAAERAESLDPAEVALALHRSRFTTVLGRVAFDAKGDMAGADWQWRMWHQGGYAPLPPAMAMR